MADESSSKRTERKVRFAPKIPPRNKPKATGPKIEVHPNAEAAKTYHEQNVKDGKAFIASEGAPSDSLTPKASDTNKNKALADPWDMSSNYPVTLPLKRPNSELNEDFEKADDLKLDETKINAAEELGLMEESEEPRPFFFQLPSLPVVTGSATAEGCSLEELPAGYLGKMQVFKSGAIKMKIGETLFDVNPGSGENIYDVTAINTEEMHCCHIGQVNKKAVVTPNIDSLLDKSKESGD